jgi:serine/threonine protein kinase
VLGRLGTHPAGHTFLGVNKEGLVALSVSREPVPTDARRRISADIEVLRQVEDRAVARVVDGDSQAVRPWIATRYVDAPTLGESVQRLGAWTAPATWRLAVDVARALRALHDAGATHRHLTPENVRLTPDGIVLVGATPMPAPESEAAIDAVDPATVAYLSPEQALGQRPGAASDIFALGSVLAFVTTGRAPFGFQASRQIRYLVAQQPPNLSGMEGELRALVEACLAKPAGSRPSAARVEKWVAERAGTLP